MSAPQDSKRYARTLNPGEVAIRGKVTVGAANALTVSGLMGATIARTGTGAFTLTLDRGYARLWGLGGTVHRAAGSAPLVPRLTQTDYVAGATTLAFVTVDTSGNAADPSSGDFFTIEALFDELGLVT